MDITLINKNMALKLVKRYWQTLRTLLILQT